MPPDALSGSFTRCEWELLKTRGRSNGAANLPALGSCQRISASLANQRYQFAAPVEAAELELATVGKYEAGAGEQVAHGGRDQDFARLRYAENACGGMDRDPSYLVTLMLDFTRVDCGASGEAMGGGDIDHCRRTPHGTRRTGKQDQEAVSCGLRLAAAEALDLAAHCLIVFREQQAPPGIAKLIQHLG